MKYTFSIATLAIAAALLVSCSKQKNDATADSTAVAAPSAATSGASAKSGSKTVAQGDGLGVVKEINTPQKSITLDHNNIPGVMDAMAMAYKLDDTSIVHGLKVGDSVAFTLADRGEGNYVVTAIRKK